jgi:hypothetical protein
VVIDPAGKIAVTPAPGQVVELAGGGQAVARATDPVGPGDPMSVWAGIVETAINVLAPGTFTPLNNFETVGAVPGGFGTIAAGGIGATCS